MPVSVILPVLDQRIEWASGDEEHALKHLRDFLITGDVSAHTAAKQMFLRLQGKARETFLFFIREAAREMDSESQAKAVWEIAKVRVIASPQELASAIKAGEVLKNTVDRLLLSAMHNGKWEMAEVLIRNGADLMAHTADQDAYTPLHYAVWHNHAGITRVLMKYGADTTKPNGRGKNALQMAQDHKCSKEVVGLLSGRPQNAKRWQFWKRNG